MGKTYESIALENANPFMGNVDGTRNDDERSEYNDSDDDAE